MILLKNDEVIDFLTAYRFFSKFLGINASYQHTPAVTYGCGSYVQSGTKWVKITG